MTSSTVLRAYGENAATFLIFQALALKPDALSTVFLANLKKFGSGRSANWPAMNSPEVWLFPSFGKRNGFGEPDVLLIFGSHVFWVEVETTINCVRGLPKLRNSLLQLWRFQLFQKAIMSGSKNKRGSRRIIGKTIGNSGEPRAAEIRLGGHGVLKQVHRKLSQVDINNCHYVLLTINKPKGGGSRAESYAALLALEAQKRTKKFPPELPRLSIENCWYAYWKGDLESKFNQTAGPSSNLDDIYVGIRKS